MSRSVSAPSSVTKTSPCWNGLIVPGSTFRYGSNFCACTRRPRAFSSRPSEAATMPLPSAETTPPVTKTYFVWGSVIVPAPAPAKQASLLASSLHRTDYSWCPAEAVEVSEPGRRLDHGSERAALADEGQEGERSDHAPPAPSRESLHGRET